MSIESFKSHVAKGSCYTLSDVHSEWESEWCLTSLLTRGVGLTGGVGFAGRVGLTGGLGRDDRYITTLLGPSQTVLLLPLDL